MPAYNKPVRNHCKAGSVSVRLVFETRAKCQDFVDRCKDDGIPFAIDSPFCCTNTNEDREIGNLFAPLRRELSDQLKLLFLDGDDEWMLAHKSSASKIAETGSENRFSNLLLLEADKHLPFLHLTCVFLVFLVNCYNGSSLKPVRPMCDGRSLASPLFRPLAGRGALFRGFSFRWVLHFVLSLTRSVVFA